MMMPTIRRSLMSWFALVIAIALLIYVILASPVNSLVVACGLVVLAGAVFAHAVGAG